MEETGENWPSDSDLDMGDNDFCFDDEGFPFDHDETTCFDERVDPIMGETDRKRRQREFKERLLALSATIPGLKKKMDNASIVERASNYVKQLQQRVMELEQQQHQQVELKRSTRNRNKGGSSSSEVSSDYCNYGKKDDHGDGTLPEVKARVLERQILVIVHCEKRKGIMVNIMSHLQNLHLSVLNSSVLPFGNSTLDITIIAQMDDGYNMTMDELVKSLRLAILTH